MITKFNKYNLINEKSTLSSLFHNNDFIRNFYKMFILPDDFKYEKLDIKDFDTFNKFYNKFLHVDTFIIENNNFILTYVNKFDRTSNIIDTFKLYIYDKKEKEMNGSGNYKLSHIYENIVKYDFVYTLKVKLENRYYQYRLESPEELKIQFEHYYKNLFVKLYKNYKDIITELLEKTDEDKNFNYYYELKNDLILVNDLIKNIWSYTSFYSIYHSNFNINNIAKFLFITNNKEFNFLKYKMWDKELSKNNLKLFNAIKDKIFDPELKKKYDYLFNANNFDLI